MLCMRPKGTVKELQRRRERAMALLKEIDGKSRGLPNKEEIQEYQALCAEDTGI